MISICSKVFHKIEAERTHLNSFYVASLTVVLKPVKDIKGKENYKPISLMNKNTRIFTKC